MKITIMAAAFVGAALLGLWLYGRIKKAVLQLIGAVNLKDKCEEAKRCCPYITMGFEQFETVYYLLQAREEETHAHYPKIYAAYTLTGRLTAPKLATREESTIIAFPRIRDYIRYAHWLEKETVNKELKRIKRNENADALNLLIDTLEEEKTRHAREAEKAKKDAVRTYTKIPVPEMSKEDIRENARQWQS